VPCSCTRCRVHMVTLSLEFPPATRAEIHHAYRRAAKACHPDRFASDTAKIHEAEERFKAVHVAYQALTEHCIETDEEVERSSDAVPGQPAPNYTSAPTAHPNPAHSSIPFGNAPGCCAAPNFPPKAEEAIARHLGASDYPIAIVDLSGEGSFSTFFLLATQGIFLRDVVGSISFLSYTDLGRVELIDRKQQGKLAFWEAIEDRLVGLSNKLALDVYRRNDTLFCSLAAHAIDPAKTALYHYLSHQKKQEAHTGF
jgi:hypothetical protein